jgi:hypothetical protein
MSCIFMVCYGDYYYVIYIKNFIKLRAAKAARSSWHGSLGRVLRAWRIARRASAIDFPIRFPTDVDSTGRPTQLTVHAGAVFISA